MRLWQATLHIPFPSLSTPSQTSYLCSNDSLQWSLTRTKYPMEVPVPPSPLLYKHFLCLLGFLVALLTIWTHMCDTQIYIYTYIFVYLFIICFTIKMYLPWRAKYLEYCVIYFFFPYRLYLALYIITILIDLWVSLTFLLSLQSMEGDETIIFEYISRIKYCSR